MPARPATSRRGRIRFLTAAVVLFAGIAPALAVPTITVTSPNGGEVWASGSSQMITWTATNPTGNVYIDLYKGGVYRQRIATVSLASQSYVWNPVCNALEDASNYRIRLFWASDTSVTDNSDAPFTITAPPLPPSLTLTYPNGGETLSPGPVTVTWVSQNYTGSVDILLDDGNTSTHLRSCTITSGQCTLNICPLTPGGSNCRFRLRGSQTVCEGSLSDDSDAPLTITGTAPLAVTSPQPGEIIPAGSFRTIKWANGSSAGNGDSLTVWLVRPGFSLLLGSASSSFGEFSNWQVCFTGVNASDYRIMLSGIDNPGCNSSYTVYSDPFTIDGLEGAQSVTLLSPNGGETLSPGQVVPITWASTNLSSAGSVRVYLDNGTRPTQLDSLVPVSAGLYHWTVPYCWDAGTNYRVNITAYACTNVSDSSDAPFTITGPGSALRVTSPNGGETLLGGTVHRVTWDSTIPIGGVLVWMNKGDEEFQVIGVASIADGGIDWPISQEIGDGLDYRVHLTAITHCNILEDESNADFTILTSLPHPPPPPPPTITVTSPIQGTVYQGGTFCPIQWTSNNPTGNVVICEITYTTYPPLDWPYIRPIAIVPMSDGHFDWPLPSCARDNPLNWHALWFFIEDYTGFYGGAFLASIRIQTAPLSPGDVNGDCAVDMLDAAVFVQTLLGQDTDLTHLRNADINRDYIVDGRDVAMFVAAILP